jgi:pimeloyl-ACP methyl ester carboxylesterase
MNLVLIPGLGVDERLFKPQRALPVPFTVPAWPDPEPGDSIEDYAARFAEKVGPCDAVGGISFGGMIAQVMAEKVGAKVVIGIATARNGRQIPGGIRFAEAISDAMSAAGGKFSLLGVIPERFRNDVIELIRTARIDVIREGSHMIATWKGAKPPCPVRLIHGARDVLIRSSVVKPDRVIRGAGHLINMTHPKAVNQFILECLEEAGLLTRGIR